MKWSPVLVVLTILFTAACDDAAESPGNESDWPRLPVFDAPVIRLEYVKFRPVGSNDKVRALPRVELDLRLPENVLEDRAFLRGGLEENTLLPELFEKKATDKIFQIEAKPLYRDRELDVRQPLEGAELLFELKQ